MNDKKLENKVRQDAAKVKKEFDLLVKDTSVRLSRFENQANQTAGKAKVELTAKVEDSLSQLSKDFEKLIEDASSVKQDVGHQFNRINAKAQKIIHKKSIDAARKNAIYSWVALSLALVVGFAMFILLKPSQQSTV